MSNRTGKYSGMSDADRTKKLTKHVYGHVAKTLLRGSSISKHHVKHPKNVISRYVIDGDGQSLPASLRVLTAAGIIKPYVKDSSDYEIFGYEEHAHEYMEEPEFLTSYDTIYEPLTTCFSINPRHLAGYTAIGSLSDACAIWVERHKVDYFLFKEEEDEDVLCYPRALETQRIKALLQSLVEYEIQTNYHTYVERYLGLPVGAISSTPLGTIEPRNFAFFPASLSEESLKGYQAEYQFYLEYMQKLHNNLLQYQALVASKGGCKSLIEQMRREAIKKYDDELLLHVNVEEKDREYSFDLSKNTPYIVGLYKFIMKHSDAFTYDYLYGMEYVPFLNLEKPDNTSFSPPTDCSLMVDPHYVPTSEDVAKDKEKEEEDALSY